MTSLHLVCLTSCGDTRLPHTDHAPDLLLVHHLGPLHLPDHGGVQLVHLVQVHRAARLDTKITDNLLTQDISHSSSWRRLLKLVAKLHGLGLGCVPLEKQEKRHNQDGEDGEQ